MREFTLRAVLLGLAMTVVLGAANAYLGLRAGMTIAATYPAAVIGMGILRLMGGSILEENIARTVGSIGESVAAGAIFTIPAFVMSGAWSTFDSPQAYWKSTALMLVGGALGILFVTLLRRVMVEDIELPFPESIAASEIHKAGQQGSKAAQLLFSAMGIGAAVYALGVLQLFAAGKEYLIYIGQMGTSLVRLGAARTARSVGVGGITAVSAPAVSPAYIGVGYIIGPRLAALNFAGGVLAWGLMVPLLIYFLGPQLKTTLPPGATEGSWSDLASGVWRFIVRPIAVGGMLVGAAYTLFRMRKSLAIGMRRAISDLKKAGTQKEATARTERDLNAKVIFAGIGVMFICMILLYTYFSGMLSGGIVAALVMIVVGFFFAAVSGNLVGMIGSSNNPVSGLTLSTLIIAALLMVTIGVSGISGVAAVLGVAAVVCVSSAVAGEMLQDLKVGHILGGTPRSMQIGDFLGVLVAGAHPLLPASGSPHRKHKGRRRWFRRSRSVGPASRIDGLARAGNCRRRYAVAARRRRHLHGIRTHHGAGEKSHAIRGRHVPSARNNFGHLCWRRDPLVYGNPARQARIQRRSKGPRGKCRGANSIGIHRRGGPHGPHLRHIRVLR